MVDAQEALTLGAKLICLHEAFRHSSAITPVSAPFHDQLLAKYRRRSFIYWRTQPSSSFPTPEVSYASRSQCVIGLI
jgi:hypothetical protein